jgi:hypothetical protein
VVQSLLVSYYDGWYPNYWCTVPLIKPGQRQQCSRVHLEVVRNFAMRRQHPMTQATRASEAINPCLSHMSAEALRMHCTQVWLEVISCAEGYDRKATAEADPSDADEIAIFTDGSQLWWDPSLQR